MLLQLPLDDIPSIPNTNTIHNPSKMSCTKAFRFTCSSRGIHSLPVELLSRIFTLGAGFDYLYDDSPFLLKPNQDYCPTPSSFPLLASHICQRWRHIALRTPSLWTVLHLREPVHIARARAYLERCSTSTTYLLDILVDTVAAQDHIAGVTLCSKEIVKVFDLVIPHVKNWRSFHLKIRDNGCKMQARHYLSTCGPAPSLETLQLYHFEDYGTPDALHLATYRPPVMCFNNTVPKLRNVSLIGVNLPWLKSPYLVNLHKLELALHLDNIRPPYDCWERMLRSSPQLQSLYLHYSGPRLESGEPNSAWTPSKEKIVLDMLSDLKFTDLDPDHLCGVVDRLYLPNVRKMCWDLPEQDFSPFIELLARNGPAEISTPKPPRRRSKISISSLLSDSDPEASDEGGEPRSDVIFGGPLPHLCRIETLIINALECTLPSWQTLLRSLEGLMQLEVDFRRVGDDFWGVFAGTVEVDKGGILKMESSRKLLLPNLKLFKLAGVSGTEIKREMQRRVKRVSYGNDGLHHWIVRWSPALRGEDAILDELAEDGCFITDKPDGLKVRVETYCEEDEEEAEEFEPGDSPDEEDSSSTGNG